MPMVKPIPDGYTAITPYLIVENAAGFIDFLTNAFGAVERLRVPMPEGGIGHAEVEIGGAALMLADAMPPAFPPTSTLIHLYVRRWTRSMPRPWRRELRPTTLRRTCSTATGWAASLTPSATTGPSRPTWRT